MPRLPQSFVLCLVAGSGIGLAQTPASAAGAAIAAVRAQRCCACHAAASPVAALLAPPPRVPLHEAAAFRAGPQLERLLAGHHGGDDAPLLAAFVRALAPAELVDAHVGPAAPQHGEVAWRRLGCIACHDAAGIADLAARTDHAHVAAFLRAPAARRPDLAHDFALDDTTASDLAAWLLRAQRQDGDAAAMRPGLQYECFELHIDTAGLPELDGRAPARTGVAANVGVGVRTRDDHFALRFRGCIAVPAAGEWTFTTGSDDSSWLWIDDRRIVTNEGLAPHHRASGTVQLEAGAHTFALVYTEAEGQESLDLRWRGPGQDEAKVPDAALATGALVLAAPRAVADGALHGGAGDEDRGRQAWQQRRCANCHELAGAPADVEAARAWDQLGSGACIAVADGAAVLAAARAALAVPLSPAIELAAALAQHECRRCHVRDGEGGLDAAARAGLEATEDLGDEGRLPPDLSGVGRRLRAEWLERVVRGAARARPYVQARMPSFAPDVAARFAHLFAAVDFAGQTEGDDAAEPPFSPAAVERGRDLAGSAGKNCVTCHCFAGRRAIGPQGMDLALQYERLRPAWFRDWVLHPTLLRPGTRMLPMFSGGDQDRADVDALRSWCALGSSAPVPRGLRSAEGSLALDPIERPILHGAFLDGLSARCLCVGSPLRGHYAYDLEHARLAWLWRGAFVDAAGTWEGRAGQLLRPLSSDFVALDDLPITDAASPSPTAARRCIGQLRTADGYPVFLLRVGDAEWEDAIRPRLRVGGIEFVRTLRCTRGRLRVGLAATSGGASVLVDGEPARAQELGEGEAVEVVYRW